MHYNAALLFLAAALDLKAGKAFVSNGAAAEDSTGGAPVYHIKAAVLAGHSKLAGSDNANATANGTETTSSNTTEKKDEKKEEKQENVTLTTPTPVTPEEAKHPNVVTHAKKAGGGYLPGSPLHTGGNSTGGQFTDDDFPPVSHTMHCVIQLAEQYFILYSVLALVQSYNEFNQMKAFTNTARILNSATSTLNFAPMLCVLFLGVRLRALQLTQGNPDKYELPQDFVKNGMTAATTSVLLQTILVLIIPLTRDGMGNPDVSSDGMPVITGGDTLAKCLTAFRWVLMIMLYGGFSVVCYGAIVMEAPKEIYPDGTPPVSPAVSCTMNLCMQYFAIYLAVAAVQTYVSFQKETTFWVAKVKVTLELAKNTVSFAPMLCVLFIGARMRALQLNPLTGNPQSWAQDCMYLCSYAVLCQLVFVIAIPLLLGGHVLGNKEIEGDVAFEVENPSLFWIMNALRYLIMLAMYGGAIAVIVSVCTIEAPSGPTPPVSPTMICVINLTIQFFVVYALLWVLLTLRQADLPDRAGNIVRSLLPMASAATKTVMFCPMLCVLFIGMRLRALQITDQQGAPQGFVQEAMYLCTYALLIQLIMVFLLPIFQTEHMSYNQQTHLSEVSKDRPVMWIVLLVIRYTALLFLYGGACTVVYGLFTIKPSTATGAGSLVPGVPVSAPPTAAF